MKTIWEQKTLATVERNNHDINIRIRINAKTDRNGILSVVLNKKTTIQTRRAIQKNKATTSVPVIEWLPGSLLEVFLCLKLICWCHIMGE